MSSNLLDNPKLFRHVVEDLPVGIYIVDQDRRIRFWNRGAEHLIGHLSHEVVGRVLEDVVQACDRRGNRLSGERCPVTMTLSQRQPQHCSAFYLHKNGHCAAVKLAKQDMARLKGELQRSIQSITDLDKLKKNIEMTVTAEGLRIELLESEKGTRSTKKEAGHGGQPGRLLRDANVTSRCLSSYRAGCTTQFGFLQGSHNGIGPDRAGTLGIEAYANVPTRPTNSSNALSERFMVTFSLGSAEAKGQTAKPPASRIIHNSATF